MLSSFILLRDDRNVTESINALLSKCVSTTPGQKECENVLRSIEVRSYTFREILISHQCEALAARQQHFEAIILTPALGNRNFMECHCNSFGYLSSPGPAA